MGSGREFCHMCLLFEAPCRRFLLILLCVYFSLVFLAKAKAKVSPACCPATCCATCCSSRRSNHCVILTDGCNCLRLVHSIVQDPQAVHSFLLKSLLFIPKVKQRLPSGAGGPERARLSRLSDPDARTLCVGDRSRSRPSCCCPRRRPCRSPVEEFGRWNRALAL